VSVVERARRVNVEGNERLTALTAVVLIVLLAVEGVTIVFMRPLVWVHLFVGLVLIGPVALKLGATGWRFARYYLRSPGYRAKGPPHLLLRATAPVVVVSTVVVLASGVWLLVAGPSARDAVLPWHKISFIVWIAFTSLHVLAHLPALPRALDAEYASRRRHRGAAASDGRRARQLALAAALVAGVVLALLLVPDFAVWHHVRHDG
jgi:hypothetical protein